MTSLTKPCICCGEVKPIDEYHKHKKMKDGHLNKCKVCIVAYVRKYRTDNIDAVRQYDRDRAKTPKRKQHITDTVRKWKEAHPERRSAQITVGNAVRDGRLFKQPCWVCGDKAQAHHPDYSRPLDVVWLCPVHHKEAHDLI